jgi:hypothetical protein
MIKHIVMWKLKDFAEGAAKAENALKVKASLEGLNGKIKGMRTLEVGVNINKSPVAYDIVLYSEFDNTEDLDKYQKHPEHLKAGEIVGKVAFERKVVDYES